MQAFPCASTACGLCAAADGARAARDANRAPSARRTARTGRFWSGFFHGGFLSFVLAAGRHWGGVNGADFSTLAAAVRATADRSAVVVGFASARPAWRGQESGIFPECLCSAVALTHSPQRALMRAVAGRRSPRQCPPELPVLSHLSRSRRPESFSTASAGFPPACPAFG